MDQCNFPGKIPTNHQRNQKSFENQFKIIKPGGGLNPRAIKACNHCRKKKTRCFAIDEAKNIAACSRCKGLGLLCSFEEDIVDAGKFQSVADLRSFEASRENNNNNNNNHHYHNNHRPDILGYRQEMDKLNQIHDDIKKLARYLTTNNESLSSIIPAPHSSTTTNYDLTTNHHQRPIINNNLGPSIASTTIQNEFPEQPKVITPSTMIPLSFMTSAYNILKEAPPASLLPFPVTHLLSPPAPVLEKDIVTLRFISKAEAYSLLNIFREKYGKWISLKPDITTEELLNEYRTESSLLLDVCCLVALRSSRNQALKRKITQILINRISNSLAKEILNNPSTDLKYISTLTLLSFYGYSLSQPANFNIDPWFYSGLALKHFITSINYNPSFINATVSFLPDADSQFDLLTYMRIYDHLIVTHLFNCVVSGRTCSIDRIRLNKIRSKLDIVYAGVFDGKMTAEVCLSDIVYDFFVNDMTGGDALGKFYAVVKKLDDWYNDWNYLIKQPIPQLLEFFFNFYSLLIHYHINFQLYFNKLNQNLLGNVNPESADHLDDFQRLFSTDPTNFETFSNIVWHIGADHLEKMWYNCLIIVNELLSFINKLNLDIMIDNSEQFEYFTDQIHFSLFFSIIVFLRLMSNFFRKPQYASTMPSVLDTATNTTSQGLLLGSYLEYFHRNFQPFDITGSLQHHKLTPQQLKARAPLHQMDKLSFLIYMTEILIIVKKYQKVSQEVGNVSNDGRVNEIDTNNVFYRYYYTLRQNIVKTFPGIKIDDVFD